GSSNAYFGTAAGRNTNGSSNAMFGSFSGQSFDGSSNAFFGAAAGGTGTGNGNTAGGAGAELSMTGGDEDTFGGDGATVDALDVSSRNTLLGANARVAPALTNATALGAYARVALSNSLVLGGITGVNGGTSVNVGIGTSAPAARLHIADGFANMLFGA